MSLLDVKNLTVSMRTGGEKLCMVDHVSFTVAEGEILGLVGESGSGKSLIAKAIVGILSDDWEVIADRLYYGDKDLLEMSSRERRELMGKDIAMIFQDPASCLDPIVKVGVQIIEALPAEGYTGPFWGKHRWLKQQAITLLHQVGIREHDRLLNSYPHELSDGLCQKVMIAMAVANKPRLLVADEPTTAMEPATETQIFKLLMKLNQLHNMSILLVSHNLNTIRRLSHRTMVVYCGQVMESAPTERLLTQPLHPYTEALLLSSPDRLSAAATKAPLPTLRGGIPTIQHLPIGCRLGPRCPRAQRECVMSPNTVKVKGRIYRCHFPLGLSKLKKRKRNEADSK